MAESKAGGLHATAEVGKKALQVVVTTPEATLLDQVCDFVVLPLYDGEIGIAPLHAPLIGRLGFGEMRVKQGEKTTRFYVEGGFVEVVDNVVAVLTNFAFAGVDLDPVKQQAELDKIAARPAATPEAKEAVRKATAIAKARLKVAQRSIVKKFSAD